MDLFVSVVVTTYNREVLLRDTIQSILDQTYQNFELIVVDNYSNYDFMSSMESFHSDKIRAYQHQNNGIIAVNRNYGISKAKGDYVAFCDDDDLWFPEKLEKQVKCIQEHKVDMVSTPLILFGPAVEKEYVFANYYRHRFELFFNNYFTPSTLLARKSEFLTFNESRDFNCAEDWTMCLELVMNGYSYYQMQEPLVRYRIAKSNMTSRSKDDIHLRAIRIIKYLDSKYPNKNSSMDLFIAMAYHYFNYTLKLLLNPIRPVYRYIKRKIFKRTF